MLVVETIGRIRREHFIHGKSIKEIARDLRLSRNTVRKVLRSDETSFSYERRVQPRPKLGRWKEQLDRLLAANVEAPARERLTLIRIFEELRALGYDGGYDAIRRYARSWAKLNASATADAFVPLTFAPGEAYQFDWSHEIVVMDGVTTIVKVAHLRLCHSRMMLVRAYPRETQEMVFDAHERAFGFFKGACARGIYDNMKTAVETIFVGKDRQYNRRFLQMCSHHLVEPVACTPASGWEKGQVENQVGLVRERFFTPRLRFKSYDELNAWLMDKCIAWAKAHGHPERPDQTIWEVFEEERPQLIAYRGRFDGFHALPASVSKTCLVRLCVQRRLACSAGERPAGARVRSPVVWIAGWRETKTLKPIDNVSLGKTTSHRAVTTVNAKVASKVRSPEGRVLNRRAKAAWGSRNLTDAAPSLRRGGSDSTVTRTCRATGEALLVPARNHRSRVDRITGSTGKSIEGERVTDGFAVAVRRGNARGAKEPCCL